MPNALKANAKTVRRSLANYSNPDDPLFRGQGFFLSIIQFLLRSGCLSLEVFLHYNFGKRYLTVPKLMIAIWLPAVCVFLSHFDFNFKVGVSMIQPGFVEILKPNAERVADAVSNEYGALRSEWAKQQRNLSRLLLEQAGKLSAESEQKVRAAESETTANSITDKIMQTEKVRALKEDYAQRISALRHKADEALVNLELEDQQTATAAADQPPSIYRRSVEFLKALVHPESRNYLLAGLGTFFAIFSLVANLQLGWVYLSRVSEMFLGTREAHPHSSGEPWFIFDLLYIPLQRLNAKTDLVKQFAEPTLCYIGGVILAQSGILSPSYSFISTWLVLGGFLIFVRMYFENRNREKLHLDRLANERNAEAFQLQNSLVANAGSDTGPVQARGK